MNTINQDIVKRIVKKLILPGQDYRTEIVPILDMQFLEFAISFFRAVAEAKLSNKRIDMDWYHENFISDTMPKNQIALNAGINIKTIDNIHGSTRKEVVINAANAHYQELCELIQQLTKNDDCIDFMLTIKIRGVSVELNINESLIVINGLAVHRAAMRGGVWSSAGKRAEKALMITLCKLYGVDDQHWDAKQKSEDGYATYTREIDFFLLEGKNRYKCEVKLMGKGNPESADAVIARGSRVFVADTLSDTNVNQFNATGIEWVQLKSETGHKRFATVLKNLAIPHTPFRGNVEKKLDEILEEIS